MTTPQEIIGRIWSDIDRMRLEQAWREAKADPAKFARSTIMQNHAGYRYWSGGWLMKSNRLEHHEFAFTVNRNIGECYLIFRNVHTYTKGGRWRKTERKEITPCDTKREARELSLKRRDRWRNEHPGFNEYKPVRQRRKKRK